MLDHYYILKHWAATLCLAPFLIGFYGLLFSTEDSWFELVALYPLFIVLGCLYALPALMGYYLFFRLLDNKNLPVLMKKMMLMAFTLISIAATFWLLEGSMAPLLCIAYSVAAIIAGLFFRLQQDKAARPAT